MARSSAGPPNGKATASETGDLPKSALESVNVSDSPHKWRVNLVSQKDEVVPPGNYCCSDLLRLFFKMGRQVLLSNALAPKGADSLILIQKIEWIT